MEKQDHVGIDHQKEPQIVVNLENLDQPEAEEKAELEDKKDNLTRCLSS